ncbi:CsgG/HfaB family protein [Thermodesulfatator indicus]|uniref:CsgG/HfaB family protein n=1 Tax=Thermodesulfatator indicus TaxID=171695 RepID=UPI00145DF6F5|nr:CsgG/HfaB family protein [Thermodesulfatator indicus]
MDTTGPSAGEVLTYKGPKARIAVASFKCKAAKCSGQIGNGIADMLATALFRSGRFIVLERGEGLSAIKEELALGQSGYVRPGAAPQAGQMEGADILVVGAITAFEPDAGGFGAGGIVVPFKVPVIGGVKVGKKEAYIAVDLRLIDVRTGRVINATTVEGKASSWKIGGLGGGIFGDIGLGGGLEMYKNTPMEKAIRVMLNNAVEAIAKLVPENYYRWGQEGAVKPVPQAPAVSSSNIVGGQPANIVGGQPASGGIVGGAENFVPGKKVLFQEDFSEYNLGDIPTKIRIVEGQVEVASFSGKKWMRALAGGRVIAEKKIKLPANFAVEWEVYFSKPRSGFGHAMFLGPARNPFSKDVLHWASDWSYPRWSDKEIRTVKLQTGRVYHFAVQQKDGMIKIYVNGRRVYQEPLGIMGATMPNRDQVTFGIWGYNPAEGYECLITNIKITAY